MRSSLKFLLIGFFAIIAFAQTGVKERGQPRRAIPDDNLAYPVLIKSNVDTGSGFFMDIGKAVYLVTANHVLFKDKTREPLAPVITLLSYSKDLSDNVPNSFTVDIGQLGPDNVKAGPQSGCCGADAFPK